jgi:hypothetical protein
MATAGYVSKSSLAVVPGPAKERRRGHGPGPGEKERLAGNNLTLAQHAAMLQQYFVVDVVVAALPTRMGRRGFKQEAQFNTRPATKSRQPQEMMGAARSAFSRWRRTRSPGLATAAASDLAGDETNARHPPVPATIPSLHCRPLLASSPLSSCTATLPSPPPTSEPLRDSVFYPPLRLCCNHLCFVPLYPLRVSIRPIPPRRTVCPYCRPLTRRHATGCPP